MIENIARRLLVALLLVPLLSLPAGATEQLVRVGMTAADIPTTGGIPNDGGEGFRFLGCPAFDALVNWDFRHPK